MISLVDTNPKKDPMDFSMLNIKEFCADWKASLKDRLDGQGAVIQRTWRNIFIIAI